MLCVCIQTAGTPVSTLWTKTVRVHFAVSTSLFPISPYPITLTVTLTQNHILTPNLNSNSTKCETAKWEVTNNDMMVLYHRRWRRGGGRGHVPP